MKCPQCHSDNPETSRFCGECGTQLPSAEEISASHTDTLRVPIEDLTTGTTFAGRYQVIEELGKGGMGKVYKVFDKNIKERVALKLIKPEIASDKETIERFSNDDWNAGIHVSRASGIERSRPAFRYLFARSHPL